MSLELNTIHLTDALAGLRQLPDDSINCVVTSPPYYGLRDYGIEGQIGLEATPAEFIARLMEVFNEIHRVLKPEGTVWVNLGDSYAYKNSKHAKAKGLMGMPWRFAFAMQDAGWYFRQDIIWSKPNPMPESVTDRCTRAHEYIFMFTKSAKYYYDAYAIRTPYQEKTYTTFGTQPKGYGDQTGLIKSENWAASIPERKPKEWKKPDGWDTGKGAHGAFHREGREKGEKPDKQRGHSRRHAGFNDRWDAMTLEEQRMGGANRRSVWEIATKPFKEAHFATFPPELPWLCIRAGCPPDGIVLDPFMGAGTTALVARGLGRDFIGFEINPEYKRIADTRLYAELGFVAKGGAE